MRKEGRAGTETEEEATRGRDSGNETGQAGRASRQRCANESPAGRAAGSRVCEWLMAGQMCGGERAMVGETVGARSEGAETGRAGP